jgi:hypothetical protein
VVDTELLLYIGKLVIKCCFHRIVKVGDNNIWLTYRVLLHKLFYTLWKELEPFSSLVIDEAKGSIKDRPKACLPCCLEEGKLETIGIIGIVKADDLRESFPHL